MSNSKQGPIVTGIWTITVEMEGRRIVAADKHGTTHRGCNYGDGSIGWNWPELIPAHVVKAANRMADRWPESRIQEVRGDMVEAGIPMRSHY